MPVPDALVLKVDVGSSYHCEAEFTKRWIVHPLNRERNAIIPIGGDSQSTSNIDVHTIDGAFAYAG